jgi:hypothetical protein
MLEANSSRDWQDSLWNDGPSCNKELFKIVQANCMDPKWAKQATEGTRDAMFFKLDFYVKPLYEMRHVSWKIYKDILKEEDLFNMNKGGNHNTKHCSKIIADKVAIMAWIFQLLVHCVYNQMNTL